LLVNSNPVKYVDYSTLTEILQPKYYNSSVSIFLDNLLVWTAVLGATVIAHQ